MELVRQGVNTEDAEYRKLYGALSPEKRDLVDSARRMLPKLQIEDDARAAAAIREACRTRREVAASKDVGTTRPRAHGHVSGIPVLPASSHYSPVTISP